MQAYIMHTPIARKLRLFHNCGTKSTGTLLANTSGALAPEKEKEPEKLAMSDNLTLALVKCKGKESFFFQHDHTCIEYRL